MANKGQRPDSQYILTRAHFVVNSRRRLMPLSKAASQCVRPIVCKSFAPKGVYVFVVAPGWVTTERVAQYMSNPSVLADQPLGRVASPEEVAKVVDILCDGCTRQLDRARYST